MSHALQQFIREQMEARTMDQAAFTKASGLSRSHASKLLLDRRDSLTRLPERATLESIAQAFRVPLDVVLAKAVEALGLGFTSGDFINDVRTASNEELLAELARRLRASERSGTRVDFAWNSDFELKAAARSGEPADVAREAKLDEDLHRSQDDGELEPR